jgi:hypothetical protein
VQKSGSSGGGGSQHVCTIERQRQRRPARVAWMTHDGGDRWSREWRGVREFCDENRNTTGRVTIYRFKTISSSS